MKVRVISQFMYSGQDQMPGTVLEVHRLEGMEFIHRGIASEFRGKAPDSSPVTVNPVPETSPQIHRKR